MKDTQTELESTSKELNARIEAEKDKTFDYLAIGNSITQHPVVEDLWWGEWGMAASDEEHDFYHLVTKAIEGKYKSTSSNVLNYTIWESPYYDRQHTLKFLDGYLHEDLDFITIDLGENCSKGNDQSSEEFQEELTRDYADLVDYIAEKCPKAKIVMIGCYWERPESDAAKQKSGTGLRYCARAGAKFPAKAAPGCHLESGGTCLRTRRRFQGILVPAARAIRRLALEAVRAENVLL